MACKFCGVAIAADALKCPACSRWLTRIDPISGLHQGADGSLWKEVHTSDGLQLFRVATHQGFIDFTGDKTGVQLPDQVLKALRAAGIGPKTRFLSRSSAHRALIEAGWTSKSGKRVGPSAFYEKS